VRWAHDNEDTCCFNGLLVALNYVSPNPTRFSEKVATIAPVDRVGTWKHGDLTLVFRKSITRFFQSDLPDDEIRKQITTEAKIDIQTVTFRPAEVV
jgi:hypothetical protein